MPQICDNAWFQPVGESAAGILAHPVLDNSARRYVHVCHPYSEGHTNSEVLTQEVTYSAMHRAREVCRGTGLEIEFLGAVFPKDKDYASKYFDRTFTLERSAKDIGSFGTERPLPLLFDIIGGAAAHSADYVVFTNVDICPVPHFYRTLDGLLARGFDGLVVNRRTLTGWPADPMMVDLMAADPGKPHEGYDCFVFARERLSRFIDTKALVGTGGVMQSLIYNLVATSQRLLFLGDVHLTYHLGDDKVWTAPHLRDYIEHNWTEAIGLLQQLATANPSRFRDFCRGFPHSRVDIFMENHGSVALRRKVGCRGFVPDLEALNRGT